MKELVYKNPFSAPIEMECNYEGFLPKNLNLWTKTKQIISKPVVWGAAIVVIGVVLFLIFKKK